MQDSVAKPPLPAVEGSFRSPPLRYISLSTREVEMAFALSPVVCPSGASADTRAYSYDHLEIVLKVKIMKKLDSFPFSHNSSLVNTRLP